MREWLGFKTEWSDHYLEFGYGLQQKYKHSGSILES